jgi:hypothetical protein
MNSPAFPSEKGAAPLARDVRVVSVGSRIERGMSQKQVELILNDEGCGWIVGLTPQTVFYPVRGIAVHYGVDGKVSKVFTIPAVR